MQFQASSSTSRRDRTECQDVIPAFVIFVSAIVAGLSADIEPDAEAEIRRLPAAVFARVPWMGPVLKNTPASLQLRRGVENIRDHLHHLLHRRDSRQGASFWGSTATRKKTVLVNLALS